MRKQLSICLFVAGLFVFSSCGDQKPKPSGTHPKLSLEEVQKEFIACKLAATEKHTCKQYVAKAINGSFEITDFNHPDSAGQYVDYDEIITVVEESSRWKNIGDATNQDALDYAQKVANEGGAALAINSKSGTGNVAIFIKGEPVKSNSWGLNCPTVAIFFPNRPKKSFIGKTLNYAWSKPDGVELFVRE